MATASTPSAESTTTQSVPHGRFVWYDLMTTDVAAATDFYTKIAGWGTQDFDMGPTKYQMWTVNGVPIGGAMALTPEMGPDTPPHWMGSVGVTDTDDTVKKATSLGASVLMPPSDIPTVGRHAIIADPQGAAIALFTPTGYQLGDVGVSTIGGFSWHELLTTDHTAAFDFYSKLFGWDKQDEFDMGSMGKYLMFGQNGQMYGGMMTKTPDMQMPSNWGYYIHVKSADDTAEQAKSLGGQLLNGPMDVPGGDRIANLMDSQGAMISVHSKPA